MPYINEDYNNLAMVWFQVNYSGANQIFLILDCLLTNNIFKNPK